MKKNHWQAHVDRYNSSGISEKKYVDKHQLDYHQFIYWSNKLSQADVEDFIPVRLKPVEKIQPTPGPHTDSLGILEFPNGNRLYIQSLDMLAILPTILNP